MTKIFIQMTQGSKFFVFIKSVWTMKCLVTIKEYLYKISILKNKSNTNYRSKRDIPFTLGKSSKLQS